MNYSSQGGNGLLGNGWSLGGMSSVSRCRQTKAIEGYVKPVALTNEDRLCLDGQRLLLDSGSWFAAGSVYKTEIDSFAKVTALTGAVGLYFKVERKDGSVSFYGADSNAQLRIGSTAISWAISQSTDNVGNPITYQYSQANNAQRLDTISYAYSNTYQAALVPTGVSGGAKIEFIYDNNGGRLDPITGYQFGQVFKVVDRLQQVQVINNGNQVRDYTLRYLKNIDSPSDLYKVTRLASVQECAKAQCLPPTVFDWSEAEQGLVASGFSLPLNDRARTKVNSYRAADINGDGLQDLIWSEYRTKSNGAPETSWVRYRIADGQGGFYDQSTALTISDNDLFPWTILDYNADGRTDIAIYNPHSKRWFVRIAKPNPNVPSGWHISGGTYDHISTSVTVADANFLDIDSDGLVDAVYSVANQVKVRKLVPAGVPATSATYYHFGNEESFSVLGAPRPSGNNFYSLNSVTLVPSGFGDFNGDGRMDIVAKLFWYAENAGCDGGGDLPFFPQCNSSDPLVTYEAILLAGDNNFNYLAKINGVKQSADFNGDGLSDLFGAGLVRLNTGSGFVDVAMPNIIEDQNPQALDYNYDGYPDVVYEDDVTKRLNVLLWNPKHNQFDAVLKVLDISADDAESLQFADITGNGRLDLMRLEGDRISTYIGRGTGAPGSTVTAITNGLGARTVLEFKPLSDQQVYSRLQVQTTAATASYFDKGMQEPVRYTTYFADSESFYQALNGPWELPAGSQTLGKTEAVFEVMAPIYVVSRVTGDAPAAGSTPGNVNVSAQSAVSYFYAEAKLQAAGRGFLGFKKIKTLNEQTQVSTTTTYRQDFPFIGHQLSAVVSSNPAAGERPLLSEANSTWNYKVFTNAGEIDGPKRYQNVLYQSQQDAYALAANGGVQGALLQRITTTSIYDNYGNPTSIDVADVGGGETFKIVTANTYGGSVFDKEMGRLSRTEVTTTRPGLAPVTRTAAFSYHDVAAHKGLLKTEVVEPDNAAFKLTTSYTYDQWGNKKTATVVGFDIPTRTVENVYDATGRYLNYSNNAKGQMLSWINNSERDDLGLPLKIHSANGATVTNVYDVLGRKIRTASNNGAYSETQVKACSYGCPIGAVYYTETTVAGVAGASSQTYLDVFGRALRSASRGFDGSWNYQDTEYNTLNQVVFQSAPYKAGATPVWTSTRYDLLGRAVATQLPGISNEATVSYNGFETIQINPKGQKKTERRNVLGELIKVTDNIGGTVGYEYDAQGNLEFTRVTALVNNQTKIYSTQIKHDLLGRKEWMDDPDKGKWFYTYYVDGSLKTQTDAKGQKVEFTYDILGRMQTRIDRNAALSIEGNTTWVYDTAVNGLGALASLHNSVSGYKESYNYDSLGRGKDVTYTLGVHGSYTEATSYDSLGRALESYDAAGALPAASPTKNRLTYAYNSYGYRSTVTDGATGKTIYRIHKMDARGNVTEAEQGNGVITTRVFDVNTGLLTDIDASLQGFEVQEQHYIWDDLGNLESRQDLSDVKTISESFTYDALNRLETSQVQGKGVKTLTYDGHGNIRSKTDVGTYTYGGESGCASSIGIGPHAVCKTSDGVYNYYDVNGNMTSDGSRNIVYSIFDKPLSISTTVDGGHTTSFAYSPSRARYLRTDTDAQNNTKKTLYIGNVEIITQANGDKEIKRALPGGAMVSLKSKAATPQTQTTNVTYLHYDHLGSVDVITDSAGMVIQAMSFDAWGLRRSGETWSDLALTQRVNFDSSITTRGFTGHEMLDEVGIIHMNGRIYDARLGRFLQADPFVDGVTKTQGYNRYSYGKNNPLNGVDPSGFGFLQDLHSKVTNFSNKGLQLDSTYHALVHATKLHFVFHAGVSRNVGFVGNIDNYIAANQWVDYAGQLIGYFNPMVGMAIGAHIAYARGGSIDDIVTSGIVSLAASYAMSKVPFSEGPLGVVQKMVLGGGQSWLNGGKFVNGAATVAFFLAIGELSERYYSSSAMPEGNCRGGGNGTLACAVQPREKIEAKTLYELENWNTVDIAPAPTRPLLGVIAIGTESTAVAGFYGQKSGHGFYYDMDRDKVGYYTQLGYGVTGLDGALAAGVEFSSVVTFDYAKSISHFKGEAISSGGSLVIFGIDYAIVPGEGFASGGFDIGPTSGGGSAVKTTTTIYE